MGRKMVAEMPSSEQAPQAVHQFRMPPPFAFRASFDPVAQRAHARQELVNFGLAENHLKTAAEVVPVAESSNVYVQWEQDIQDLESIEGVKEGIVQQFSQIELAGIKSEDGSVLGQMRVLIEETAAQLRKIRDVTECSGSLVDIHTLLPTAGMGVLQHASAMLDQFTYVDAAIAEAQSFAENIGSNYSAHRMHHSACDSIDDDIASIMAQVHKKAPPKKLMDCNWADRDYIHRLKERRSLSFTEWRPEVDKLYSQLRRMEDHAMTGSQDHAIAGASKPTLPRF